MVCRGGGGNVCNGGPGSAIPNAALAGYLRPGPDGFITADFNRFLGDTNYYALRDSAPETNSANTGASAGGIREKTGVSISKPTRKPRYGTARCASMPACAT